MNDLFALPSAVRIQDLHEESLVQAEFARGLGAIALGVGEVHDNKQAILGKVERAQNGDMEPLAEDVRFAIIESLTSKGATDELEIHRDEKGLHQNGTYLYDMHANTLRLHPGDDPGLHAVNRTEALNHHAIDVLDRAGYFRDGYVLVVPRPVPKGVPGRSLRQYGHFENIAVSWSFIWEDRPGVLKMRNLFTAGAETDEFEEDPDKAMSAEALDEMYENRLGRRHDLEAIVGVYESLGLPAPKSIEEMQRGFLRKRSAFKDPNNPFADIAERNDDQLGPDYYLGQKGKREDYVAHAARRADALKALLAKTPEIIDEVIAASKPYVESQNHMAVAHKLAKIVKHHAVEYLIDHPEERRVVGEKVLGLAACNDMRERDRRLAEGDLVGAELLRISIHNKARANMCGFDGTESDAGSKEKKNGQREWMYCVHCPLCKEDGVDAYIDTFPEENRKVITCCTCHGSKEYQL
ncbi:MAG TPA: hypothetical protein VIM53_04680 [Candidatus Saccharimonadales bacterium]